MKTLNDFFFYIFGFLYRFTTLITRSGITPSQVTGGGHTAVITEKNR